VSSLRRIAAARPASAALAALATAAALAPLALSGGSAGRPDQRLVASKRAPGKVRVDSVTETAIKLKWRDRAHGERRYKVRHRPQGTEEWTLEKLKRNSTVFTNGGLEPGSVHEHQVRACGRHTCSKWSAVRTQATLLAPFNGPHPDLGCGVLPPTDAFNQDVSGLPTDPNSDAYIAQINSDGGDMMHPDFGSNLDYGIPFVVVPGNQPRVPIGFDQYGDESDPGPYPVPPRAPVEGGSDDHALVVERPDLPGGPCTLYEMYASKYRDGTTNRWTAGSAAVFDLGSPLPQRPEGWTSADAAGLPIFPGLVRYEEVAAGFIGHAIRVTFAETQNGYVHPATHRASSSANCNRPPMGLRLRLRQSWFDANAPGFSGQALVILEALRRYGMIVADNGSNWFITGSTDPRWDDENLNQLKDVPGTAFEVVDTGEPIRPADAPCAG
jgi:fibronectin type III domain protein